MTIEELEREVLGLPDVLREHLAHRIIASLEGGERTVEVDDGWWGDDARGAWEWPDEDAPAGMAGESDDTSPDYLAWSREVDAMSPEEWIEIFGSGGRTAV